MAGMAHGCVRSLGPSRTGLGEQMRRMLIISAVVAAFLVPVPAVAAPMCGGHVATIVGDAGDNVLIGGPGRDVIFAGGGNDTISGKGGNDVICGAAGADIINGGPGNDIILAGSGHDEVNGGDGNDKIWGGDGFDVLNGNRGRDTIIGGRGSDTIDGGGGHDPLLSGQGKHDTVRGGPGDDLILGGPGNDLLIGNGGDDELFGDVGTDDLRGSNGLDHCFDGESHSSCEVQSWAPFVLEGSGDDIVAFKVPANDTAVVRFSYASGSNFIVWSLNANLESIDLLVNEIGAYEGGRPINTGSFFDEPARYLDVTASGPWSASVEPLALARSFSNQISGTSDDVVVVNSSGILDATYVGSSNFIIWSYEPDGDTDLLVNEIGNTTQAAVVGSQVTYLDVVGIGDWTLDFR